MATMSGRHVVEIISAALSRPVRASLASIAWHCNVAVHADHGHGPQRALMSEH
jgi:hypothetical protein